MSSTTVTITPQSPLICVPGVGEKVAERLEKLGLHVLGDCLWHFPLRYEDRAHIWPIADCISGQSAFITGTVISVQIIPRPKPWLKVGVQDETGVCYLHFYHYPRQQMKRFEQGQTVYCFGTPYRKQAWQMVHPECYWREPELPDTYTPVYPALQGMSQNLIRKTILWAVRRLAPDIQEALPHDIAKDFSYPLSGAICWLHEPPLSVSSNILQARAHPIYERLIVEELLAHQLASRIRQQQLPDAKAFTQTQMQPFLETLPFVLTAAQETVWRDIQVDLQQNKPMSRLLQGDVGSGKTVIAAMALYACWSSGHQAALMVPTEVLAEQHYHKLQQWLTPLGVPVCRLTGQLKAKEKKACLTALAEDNVVVVGTHALFQSEVTYRDLALVIMDEQHRFGVHQRWALREKGCERGFAPHQLVMTATPIPRTLAMAAYGEMAVSVIDTLPPGRQPIKTAVFAQDKAESVITRLNTWTESGKQSYWICPLIEASEKLDCRAAEDTHHALAQKLPNARIGLIHGRMSSDEKQAVMHAFSSHELDILVATTVIEVGVDVPNASLIVIDNAERLGLAQLHQLRGRVGRGSTESFCVLLYQAPLSPVATARLNIMRESNDGFLIAEKDFEMRGPGEFFGTRQTGVPLYKVADLQKDGQYLAKARVLALTWDPSWPVSPLLERWLGQKFDYQTA